MFKRLLSADLKVWHLLLVIAVLAVSTDSTLASENMTPSKPNLSSDAFFPSGALNMAAASSNTSQTVHAADGKVEVLRVVFTVPAGQTASIAVFFNAEAFKYANGYCYLAFYLDSIGAGNQLKPGNLWVADGYVYKGAYPTISAQGYRPSVAAGTHSVVVALNTTSGDCYVNDRSIILLSNRPA